MIQKFEDCNTQPLGVSIDSVYSHANWAKSLGGVSFPLLSDFHPRGALASSLGVFLEDAGITDRATVVIDADGVVQYANSVGPGGSRDMNDLLKICQDIDAKYDSPLEKSKKLGIPKDTKLYIKSKCGFSSSVLMAIENLRLGETITVCNVSEDEKYKGELKELTGKEQAPCLVIEGKPLLESQDIIQRLVNSHTGL